MVGQDRPLEWCQKGLLKLRASFSFWFICWGRDTPSHRVKCFLASFLMGRHLVDSWLQTQPRNELDTRHPSSGWT